MAAFWPWLLLSLPYLLCSIFIRCFIEVKLDVYVFLRLNPGLRSVIWVCLVTHCSDTNLLVSYNNDLPHTVHPLCSCPALMQNTKELSPTFLPIRRHMDMSHNNRPVTRPFLPSESQPQIRYSASFYTFDQPKVFLLIQSYPIRAGALKSGQTDTETRTISIKDGTRLINYKGMEFILFKSQICNSAARPDVSCHVVIREDLLKPIKGVLP